MERKGLERRGGEGLDYYSKKDTGRNVLTETQSERCTDSETGK